MLPCEVPLPLGKKCLTLEDNSDMWTGGELFCKAVISSSSSSWFLQELSVLQFPLQLFSSSLTSVWRRIRNLAFQARKSA
ncbi:hypothetical protein EYF80_033204 [Liparis tanakae]|uniref:Uncharacterized protein n=1 Tax=Liparis tanakae TaxID=230148 RepID=A0A4Z2GT44_9TELE|nr:hypothetical protein EYF80_033204 [Liparis tanakae]